MSQREERTNYGKSEANQILIRLSHLPRGTRIRTIKDELTSISCRPLYVLWKHQKHTATLVYSRRDYPKKKLLELMERLRRIPYPAELLSPLEKKVTQQHIEVSPSILTSARRRRQPRNRRLNNSSGRSNDRQPKQSQHKGARKLRDIPVTHTTVSVEGEVVQAFSQMSLGDFPPLFSGSKKA